MRIRHRFGYQSNSIDIVGFLRSHNIKFTEGELVSTLDIFEDDVDFNAINEFFSSYGVYPLSEAVFTYSELSNAQWLSVRSTWRNGYPLPRDNMGYRNTTYNADHYCDKCGAGLIQKESFVLAKEPDWSTRNFLMLNWIHDELFMSQKATDRLCDSGYTGFQAMDVCSKAGAAMQKTKQMFIANVLSGGLCDTSVSSTQICEKCGGRRHMLKISLVKYEREAFENTPYDVVKSAEQFGEITCSRMIFMSQRLYQLIISAKLNRGLVFEPIELV